ncbi:hypothetical protein E0Z10_g2284 [Xylaria hypoxylon]|uniref:Uncharacterized protein n=1 Tax=Xylaria hypoxylon TaxID=37992 RepID=A0A4Z0YRB7_9PEZI|nr:hypothetical protein E0Z10_g2284 [Xylaria hypoxylon]
MADSNPSPKPTGSTPVVEQDTKYLQRDFTPDNPNFTRARDNETLYWLSSYKELDDQKLFARAAKTRDRLIPDLKTTLFNDTYSIQRIKKRLAELVWLESHEYAPVHVYLEPIVAAHSDSALGDDLYDYRAGVSLGGGFELHVDIARISESDSLCGCPCRSRITLHSKVVNESFCRIGGALRINDSVDALITTAHGILSYFLSEILPLLEETNVTENQLHTSDESSDESDMEDSFPEEKRGDIDPDSSRTDTLGYMDMSQLLHWEPLKPFDTITYIAQAKQTDMDMMWNLLFRNFDADYALFRQSELSRLSWSLPPNNLYTSDPKDPDVESVRGISLEDPQYDLPVEFETGYILLGAQEVIPVQLFLDEVEISIHGAKFKTLKLRAPKVLARGTSGSWVVRGEKLCGVIIALYQFEPYALMLPATAVSRDLIQLGASIETVSLPLTDYDPLSGIVGAGQPSNTTISMFDTFRIPLLETSIPSFTLSEPPAIPPNRSTSQDTPPSRAFHEWREPQAAHPRPIHLNINPWSRPSDQLPSPPTTQPPSVGTSVVPVFYGDMSVSRTIPKREAAQMQQARLAPIQEDANDEDVTTRLRTGRPPNPREARERAARDCIDHFNDQFHGHGSSLSEGDPSTQSLRSPVRDPNDLI